MQQYDNMTNYNEVSGNLGPDHGHTQIGHGQGQTKIGHG